MIDIIWSTLPFLLEGLWMTFIISIITIFFGSILGAAIGLVRTTNIRVLNLIFVVRTTPNG